MRPFSSHLNNINLSLCHTGMVQKPQSKMAETEAWGTGAFEEVTGK